MTLEQLIKDGEAPAWLKSEGLKTLQGGYLLPGETPRGMYKRVANAAASYYPESAQYWAQRFFTAMWDNHLCLASPVAANMGSTRGLPISCNSIHVGDSIDSIFMKSHELAMLSKSGAGVGIYCGDVRPRAAKITGNGASEGVIPWLKVYDATTVSVSQGGVRRGASAFYLPINHGDISEFMPIRRPTGDMNRRCLNVNQGVCISDAWMSDMLAGDKEKRELWKEILKTRVETGEPYLMFTDTANRLNPDCYKANGLSVKTSNICCVSGDTLVMTSTGPVRIDSLTGQEVRIWDGINWVSTNTFSQRGEDELIRIKFSDGSHVDCNANHRWFIANSYNDIRTGKYRETLAKDLKIGTWCESFTQEVHGSSTTKGAYVKGFLLGDGTHTRDRPMLCLHSTKYVCEEALIKSAEEIPPGVKNTNAQEDPSFSDEIVVPDQWGRQVFKRMQGIGIRKQELFNWTHTYKSKLPEEVFTWDLQTKLNFLAGILDSDGTVGNKYDQLQISSVHSEFILDLYYLFKTLGCHPGMDTHVKPNKTPIYRITIGPYEGHRLLKILPCQRLKSSGYVPDRKTTGYRRIKSIEKLPGIHPVYCPTLPTTGKFGLANGLMTGNTEIFLHTDPDHSFVCCLSSLNLVRYDEWKDTDLVNVAVRFLDAVLSEYIEKSEGVPGLECSRRSAIKGRAIGIGVLGWHTLLQERRISFDSFDAMCLNNEIFRTMRLKSDEETSKLAQELGEPEWCKGFGRRNTHCLAVAPTVSNSTISGGHSAGIEPLSANIYSQKSAKGTFIRKNPTLEKLLQDKGKDDTQTWQSITQNDGSVQQLDCMSDEEKAVFLTAREINQHAIIKQAAQRQRWIDQGQSVNLFFSSNADPKYIHEVHLAAWHEGLKSLYYLRATGVLKGDLASRSKDECSACEA
jgi:ribonucleotide reductase alpha subunit